MQISEYQQMQNFENTYWWHIGRKSIVKHQLQKTFSQRKDLKILNVGCGTGGGINVLEKFGEVHNIDVSPEAIRLTKLAGFKNVKIYDGKKIPYPSHYFDLIIALDVLEHIEDDAGALKEWTEHLKTDGHILVTVPAYQWLWSRHDDALHHFRRYTASQVHRLMSISGMRVLKRSYVIVFSLPLIVGFRLLQGVLQTSHDEAASSYVILPKPINWFFTSLLQLEARILKFTSMPFGTSVLCLARKQTKAQS